MNFDLQIKKLYLKLIFGFHVIFPVFAYGKDTYKVEIPTPFPYKLRLELGKPIELIMDNGSIAQLQLRKLEEQTFDIPIGIEESTCSDVKPVNLCTMRFGLSNFSLALKWIKNEEDPSKTGEELIKNEEPLVEFSNHFTTETKKLFPDESKNISPYEMYCDDFRWVGQDKKGAPDHLDVVDWSNELMIANPESNLEENKAFQGAMGVRFAKTTSQSIQLQDFSYITSILQSALSLLGGDVIGWVLRKPRTEELCQVSMKADPQAVQKAFFQTTKPGAEALFLPFNYDPKSAIWRLYVSRGSDNIGPELEHLEEPYRTMMLLGLINISTEITKRVLTLYPAVFK